MYGSILGKVDLVKDRVKDLKAFRGLNIDDFCPESPRLMHPLIARRC